MHTKSVIFCSASLLLFSFGCGGASDAQLPPTTGEAALTAWLDRGTYKSWHCEAEPHEQRSPSPHGYNRICSNDVLSAHGAGEYPVDAAAVKELSNASGTRMGVAVYRHVKAGTGGESWYWYEKAGAQTVADGTGATGPAKDICVSCHQAAGSDAAHFGHDFVYTHVN